MVRGNARASSILIRADGDERVGLGHVMRQLHLARFLKERARARVAFLTRSHPRVARLIRSWGFEAIPFHAATDALEDQAVSERLRRLRPDVAVVDILRRDDEPGYMSHFTRVARRTIAVTDDSHRRLIACDGVVNANFNQWGDLYRDCAGATRYYVGPSYFMMAPEFAAFHDRTRAIRPTVEEILVAFSSVDSTNVPARVARALSGLRFRGRLRVLVSVLYEGEDELRRAASGAPFRLEVLRQSREMARLLWEADLAVVSGGNILYEACAAGTPTVVVSQVRRQDEQAAKADWMGMVRNVGLAPSVGEGEILAGLEDLLSSWQTRRSLSGCAKRMVDGRGLRRVAAVTLGRDPEV